RILHRAKNNDFASKRVASAWVEKTYGNHWSDLVNMAEGWQHGKAMGSDKEEKDFIKFTQEQIGA
ncbi:MAG: hypothetical protein AAB896_03060, partial [Patescibacteria group bacterium]